MDTWTLIFIAFALAIDAFTVALAAGAYLLKANRRQMFRLSFHFGLFQFLMPILGWLAGSMFAEVIEAVDHWIAFALLGYIGVRMIVLSFREGNERMKKDVTRGWSLIQLSIATSIDALAVGLSLSMIDSEIMFPSVVIGLVAAMMTLLGLRLGEHIASKVSKRMELVAGIVLILIGVRIVLDHTGWP